MTTQIKSTPLDTLKQIAHVVSELLDVLMDDFGGTYNVDDDNVAFELTDSIRMELTKALAEHIPDLSWGPTFGEQIYHSDAARQAVRTFDDGTPVWRQMQFGHSVTFYYPRRDGPREEYVARMIELIAEDAASRIEPPHEPDGDWTGEETIENIETAVQLLNNAAEPTNTDQSFEVMAGLAEWQFDATALAALGVADPRVARDLVQLLHAATHAVRGDVDPNLIVQSVGIIGGRLAHRIAGVTR